MIASRRRRRAKVRIRSHKLGRGAMKRRQFFGDQLKRREFITLLGGAAVTWPLRLSAQQAERMRRIGVLMHLAADDPEGQAHIGAFLQGLQEWGWAVGRNVRIEYRWAAGDADRIGKYAADWSRSRRTSSWPQAALLWRRCCRRPARCPSCSRRPLIRSGPASSRACDGRRKCHRFYNLRIRH
jgi:hypothetical protein